MPFKRPTHFPGGVNQCLPSDPTYMWPYMDPFRFHTYVDDFDLFSGTLWTQTKVGTGTVANISEDGGVIAIVNSAANNDSVGIQPLFSSFKPNGGQALSAGTKRLFYRTRVLVDDATNASLVVGLQITGTTPETATDGIYFAKPAGATTLNLVIKAAAASTTTFNVASMVMANNTYMDLAYFWDDRDQLIHVFINSTEVGQAVATNVPVTINLAPTFYCKNGTAAARTAKCDYMLVSNER